MTVIPDVCQHKSNNPPPGCKPDIPGLIGSLSAVGFFALTVTLILWYRRRRKDRALAVQREGENAAEAAEATNPQAAALQPRIRVRVTEPLLPHIDRAETVPLYDLNAVGAPLSRYSETGIIRYDDYNNHRRILLDPEGHPLDPPDPSTSHEKGTEFGSPHSTPLQVLASSGAPLDPPPDFRDESVNVRRMEQYEPPPAYPPPVYSVGSRPVG